MVLKGEEFMEIIDRVKNTNLIEKNDRLILGLSGGSDSMCLLNILLELREEYNINVVAVHINHMIREEADDDENSLRDFCDSVDVDFYSKKIDVPAFAKENRLSSEDAGRICRYDFFNEILKQTNSNKIVTAHNLNDVVETVFMNLIRGTGLNGLTGIDYFQGNVIRPLLDVSKSEIEDYCKANNIPVRVDKTNYENDYTRNKIRNIVLPIIREEINSSVDFNVSNMVKILKEDEEELKRLANETYKSIINKNSLKKTEFNNLSKAIKRRVLREYILEIRHSLKDISLDKVDELIEFVGKFGTGKRIDIIDGFYLEISYDSIIVKSKEEKQNFCYELKIPGTTYIPELRASIVATLRDATDSEDIIKDKRVKIFDIEKTGKKLYVRNRRDGDKFMPSGMKGTRKLKDFFMDLKLERTRRDKIPLIVNDEDIIWVVGIRSSDRYRKDMNSKEVVYFEYKEDV